MNEITDPTLKHIASLERELVEHRRIIGLLVQRLGGSVAVHDGELAGDAVLYHAESVAERGWRLWIGDRPESLAAADPDERG